MKREFYSQPTWNLIDRVYEAGQSPSSWPTLLDGLFRGLMLNQSGTLAREALSDFEAELFPHFEKALQLNRHIDRERSTERSLEPALSALSFAFVVIDADFTVLYENELFRLTDHFPGGRRNGDRLEIEDPHLCEALESLLQPSTSTADLNTLSAGSGENQRLLVMPLQPRQGQRLLALALPDPASSSQTRLDSQAAAYELTPAEVETLELLLAGRSVKEITRERGISDNTARTQIKSLMSKIGVSSQADLIRTVLCGPILLNRLLRSPLPRYADESLDSQRRNQKLTLEDGRTLGFAEYGPESGQPVLMMQNFNGSRRQLPIQESALFNQDVRLIIPDRVGVGLSDRARGYSLAESGQDMKQLLDALGIERTYLFGSSIGCAYALAFAHDHPDRVHRAAIVGSMAELPLEASLEHFESRTRKMFTLARRAPQALRFLLAIMRRESPEVMLEGVRGGQPAVDQLLYEDPAYRQMMLEVFMDTSRRDSASLAFDITLMANPWPFRAEDCRVPVDCWHGTADPTFPVRHLRPFIERLPNCRSNLLEDETHLLIYRHWHTVLASLLDPI